MKQFKNIVKNKIKGTADLLYDREQLDLGALINNPIDIALRKKVGISARALKAAVDASQPINRRRSNSVPNLGPLGPRMPKLLDQALSDSTEVFIEDAYAKVTEQSGPVVGAPLHDIGVPVSILDTTTQSNPSCTNKNIETENEYMTMDDLRTPIMSKTVISQANATTVLMDNTSKNVEGEENSEGGEPPPPETQEDRYSYINEYIIEIPALWLEIQALSKEQRNKLLLAANLESLSDIAMDTRICDKDSVKLSNIKIQASSTPKSGGTVPPLWRTINNVTKLTQNAAYAGAKSQSSLPGHHTFLKSDGKIRYVEKPTIIEEDLRSASSDGWDYNLEGWGDSKNEEGVPVTDSVTPTLATPLPLYQSKVARDFLSITNRRIGSLNNPHRSNVTRDHDREKRLDTLERQARLLRVRLEDCSRYSDQVVTWKDINDIQTTIHSLKKAQLNKNLEQEATCLIVGKALEEAFRTYLNVRKIIGKSPTKPTTHGSQDTGKQSGYPDPRGATHKTVNQSQGSTQDENNLASGGYGGDRGNPDDDDGDDSGSDGSNGDGSGGDRGGNNNPRRPLPGPRVSRGGAKIPQGSQGVTEEFLARLTDNMERSTRTQEDIARILGRSRDTQRTGYNEYQNAVKSLPYFTGQPRHNHDGVAPVARNFQEDSAEQWASLFTGICNSWELDGASQRNMFFEKLCGEAYRFMLPHRSTTVGCDKLLDHLLMRFVSMRTLKDVCEELSLLKPVPGESLPLFMGRLERIANDYQRLAPECDETYKRILIWQHFTQQCCDYTLMEKLTEKGINSKQLETAVRVAQMYYDAHNLFPFSAKHIRQHHNSQKNGDKSFFSDKANMVTMTETEPSRVNTVQTVKKCHGCGQEGHLIVDCVRQGDFRHLRTPQNLNNTPANAIPAYNNPARKKCSWCQSLEHPTMQCPLYTRISNHALKKNGHPPQNEGAPAPVGFTNRGRGGVSKGQGAW